MCESSRSPDLGKSNHPSHSNVSFAVFAPVKIQLANHKHSKNMLTPISVCLCMSFKFPSSSLRLAADVSEHCVVVVLSFV